MERLGEDLGGKLDRALSASRGALGAASGIAHLHDRALGPGNRAAEQQQVAIGVDVDDLRPGWVTRRLPIWPGSRVPFMTCDGVALAPIEPGARTLCEPWLTGPREKPWRRIVP